MKTWTSFFHSKVTRDGEVIHDSGWRPNLRTTSADWRSGLDWQSKVMGGDVSIGANASGTNSTAPTATTITLNGASAPGSTSAYNGHKVWRGGVFGVILSNTNVSSPVLTIDQWNDPAVPGTAASTPAAGVWQIADGNAAASWLALTADSVAPAVSDTTLTAEITTGGLARSIGTYSHTSGGTSYQLQKVFNATATFTVSKEAVFAAANGGAMPFESAEPNPPTLVSGDQLTQTVVVNI